MANVPSTSQPDQVYVRVAQPVPQSPAQTVQTVAPPALVRCPDGSLVQAGQACPQPKINWVPWLVGAAAVAAGVGAAYYLARKKGLVAEGAEEVEGIAMERRHRPSKSEKSSELFRYRGYDVVVSYVPSRDDFYVVAHDRDGKQLGRSKRYATKDEARRAIKRTIDAAHECDECGG